MTRVAGLVGAVAGVSILGSGLAMADATAYVAGGGGRALRLVEQRPQGVGHSCDGAYVAAVWKWSQSGTQRAIVDTVCENNDPASRTLDPPASATYIWIQACKVDPPTGILYSCGVWQRTHK